MNSATSTSEQRTNTLFFSIMETTPMGLLLGAALGLLIAGVFQFIFYLTILPDTWSVLLRTILSTGLAVFFEMLAFFFLVATVRDFSSGAKREGWIGVSASLLLLTYCAWEAIHIASVFDNNTAEGFWSICSILGTIILAVRVVELRITLTVSSAYKKADTERSLQTIINEMMAENGSILLKLQKYQAEEAEVEANKLRIQQIKQQEEAEARDAEYRSNIAELNRLRKALEKTEGEKKTVRSGVQLDSEVVKTAFRYFDKNTRKLTVTRERIAAECNTTTRTLSTRFPNGSLEAKLLMMAESHQDQLQEVI